MEINLIDWLIDGLIEDSGSKHIRDKHNVSMATSERQPPQASSYWPNKTQYSRDGEEISPR